VLEHFDECLEQQLQITIRKARTLDGVRCQRSGDKAVRAVEAVRRNIFAAHRALIPRFSLFSPSNRSLFFRALVAAMRVIEI
jgi:hypothetical protein